MSDIWITGMGLSTPLGEGLTSNWEALVSGRKRPAPRTQTSALERAKDIAAHVSAEALHTANLSDNPMAPDRIGCTVSVSKPLLELKSSSPRACLPVGRRGGNDDLFIVPPEVINRFVCDRFQIRGESRNVVAACATGAYSIALGASWIEQGLCDVVVAGSVEPYPSALIEAGFRQMGVVSQEPVMRPFDQRRSGFIFGEGGGVVVLESAQHATQRGQKPFAVLSGWGLGSDGHSAYAFNSGGAVISGVIKTALARAGLSPNAIDHVNAHGTATRLNDWIETQALIKVFGAHAENLLISATKSSTGHLLGAAGSVGFVFAVLALAHQYAPPTEHFAEPDPACPLNYVASQGHAATMNHALALALGFGGPIGALVISKVRHPPRSLAGDPAVSTSTPLDPGLRPAGMTNGGDVL